jgi:mRNA-degrading endonuclease HigB of HigAB toxin-antitoxin module
MYTSEQSNKIRTLLKKQIEAMASKYPQFASELKSMSTSIDYSSPEMLNEWIGKFNFFLQSDLKPLFDDPANFLAEVISPLKAEWEALLL